MSERRVRLCGYSTAMLAHAISRIESDLEQVYDYASRNLKQLAIDYLKYVEMDIEWATNLLKWVERACGLRPGSGADFESTAKSLSASLYYVKEDPLLAESTRRHYRDYFAKDMVEMFLR